MLGPLRARSLRSVRSVRTIADDLLRVVLDDDSGRPRVDGTRLDYALGGALLLELALNGRIDVLPGGRPRRPSSSWTPGPWRTRSWTTHCAGSPTAEGAPTSWCHV
jgi:hypothetical protein